MIADIEIMGGAVAEATVWGNKKCYKTKLHRIDLGGQLIGLLVRSDNCLLAVFANHYSEALRKFIDRCNFSFVSDGSADLGKLLDVGYCRVIASVNFLSDLCSDVSACCKLRVELREILSDGSCGKGEEACND